MSEAIRQAEIELEQVRQNGEGLVQAFQTVAPLYAADLANYFIRSAVEHKPEITKALNETGRLGELKSKLQEYLKALPDKSKMEMQSLNWQHRSNPSAMTDSMKYYELARSASESMDTFIRRLLSGIGSLLIQYGYEKSEGRSAWESKGGKLQYSYGLPDNSLDSAKQFNELKIRYKKLIENDYRIAADKLSSAIQAKEQSDAKALWEKA